MKVFSLLERLVLLKKKKVNSDFGESFTPLKGLRCIFTAVVMLGLVMQTEAQLLNYQDFNLGTAGNASTSSPISWSTNGSGTQTFNIASATPISYSGYAGGGCNYLAVTKGNATAINVSTPSLGVASGTNTFFYSFLLNVGTLPTASNYFAAIAPASTSAASAYSAVLWMKNVTGGYALGISKTVALGANYKSTPTVLSAGTTYLVLVEYVYASGTTNDQVYLWINPTISSQPSTSTFTGEISYTTASGTDPGAFTGTSGVFSLTNGATSTGPSYSFDGLRVAYGSTAANAWTGLAPVPLTFPASGSSFATGTYLVPALVTSLSVQCWGGGGGGGSAYADWTNLTNDAAGGGGGGGAYSITTISSVVPGQLINVTVGTGGAGGTAGTGTTTSSGGANGGTSSVSFCSTVASAAGGGGGGGSYDAYGGGSAGSGGNFIGAGGAGGGATGSTGTINPGGNGGAGFYSSAHYDNGGGGGGGAGSSAGGSNGTAGTGTNVVSAGGSGGSAGGGAGGSGPKISAESDNATAGNPGNNYGGGGGGAVAGNSNGSISVESANGGAGASGQVIISYVTCTTPSVVFTETDASGTSNDGKVCQGGSAGLSVPTGAAGYSWSTSATTNSISLTSLTTTTTYTVTANNSTCSATASYTITVEPALTVAPPTTTPICSGTSIAANASGGSGTYSTYAWTPTASTSNITVSTGGTYTVTVTDNVGCTGSGSTGAITTVSALGAPGTPTGNASICAGSTNTYTTAGISGAVTYQWTLPSGWTGTSTTSSISATAGVTGGNIAVQGINACGAGTTSAALAVTVNAPAAPTSVTPSGATSICNGASLNLNATSAGNTINWYTVSTSGTAVTTGVASGVNYSATPGGSPTTYYAEAQTSGGCKSTTRTATGVITLYTTSIAATATPTNETTCNNGTGSISLSGISGGSGSRIYLWSNGATTQNLSSLVAGTYTVAITDATCTGVSGTASATITAPWAATAGSNQTLCGSSVTLSGGYTGSLPSSSGAATALSQNFDAGGLPSGWTRSDLNGTGYTDFPSTSENVSGGDTWTGNGFGGTGYCMYFYTYVISSGYTGTLQTPALDLSTYSAATLTFEMYNSGGSDYLNVYAKNGAGTYSVIGSTYTTTSGWQLVTISLSSYIGGTNTAVKIEFQGTSDDGASNIAIDNVVVSGNASVTGTASYNWSGPGSFTSTLQSPSVSTTGTYTLTVSSGGCSAAGTVNVAPGISAAITETDASGTSNDGKVCQSGTATLTVPAGATTYNWSNSGTTNTITTAALTSNTTYTVTVSTPGCTATSTYTVTANPAISAAPPTTTPVCNGATIAANASGGSGTFSTYAWSNSATASSITVTSAGTYVVTVTDNLGCTGSGSTGAITIGSVPSQPSAITGSASPCQNSPQVYSVTNVSGVTYTWAFPSGWTQTAGGTTNSVTVTVGSTSGSVTVTPSNTCGSGTAQTLATTVSLLPAQPSAITGSTTPCQNSSQTYSVTNVSGVTYTWAFPSGWTQTAGGTTNSVTVTTSTTSGSVTVTPSNSCGNGTAQTLAITISPVPAQPSAITGSTSPCPSTSQVYSVTNVSGVTYTWAFPSGWAQTAGGTTNSVTVTTGSTSGSVTVTPSNSCGNGTTRTLAVTLASVPAQPSAVSGSATPCPGSSQIYSVTNVSGVTYTWAFPSGWTQTAGGTTNSVTVTAGSSSGNITATPSNTCGNGTVRTLAVTPTAAPTLSISPNPASVCGGVGAVLTVSGSSSYTWSPSTNLSATTGASITATPTSSTTYTVTEGASGCNSTASVTVNVGATVTTTAAASPAAVCSGAAVNLTATASPASAGSTTVLATETFEGTFPNTGWAVSGNSAGYNWSKVTAYSKCSSLPNNGNNVAYFESYYNTSGDSSGLATPVFSLVGYSAATLNYQMQSVSTTTTRIDISTNGGTSYVTLVPNFSTGLGLNSLTASLNAYAGMSNLRIRFSGVSNYGSIDICSNGILLDNVGITGTPIAYTYNYAWSSSPSGFSSTSQNPTANPTVGTTYTVTATDATSGCSASSSTAAVNIITVPGQPSAITGSATPCQGSSQAYSVTNVSGVIYTWAFPSGWTQTAGGTTNAVTVTVGSTSGSITVTPSTSCGSGTAQTLAATVSSLPAQPSAITGNTTVCSGSSQAYSVNNVGGVTYTWAFPSGWTQTAGGTTNAVTVTAGSTSGNITVTPSTCGNGTPQTLATTVVTAVPSQPSTISGTAAVCSGSSQAYSVTNVSGVTYTWAFPGGWTQTAGGTTNAVTVTAGATSGNITVTPSNTCGNGTARNLAVTGASALGAPGTPTGTASICAGSTNVYTTTGVTGATSYIWSLPSGLTGTSTTSSISTLAGSGGGNITVAGSNACGMGTASSAFAVTINPNPSVSVSSNTPVCSGSSINLTATPSSGTSPYAYSWSGPNSFTNTTTGTPVISSATSANAGTYNVTVTDNKGCTVTGSTAVALAATPTAPSAITSSSVTASTATVSWTGTTGATYNLQYRISCPVGSWTTVSGISSTSQGLTGLNPATQYDVQVQAATCAGSSSYTLSSALFSTSCAAISNLPWNEGFECLPTTGADILPPCWTDLNTGAGIWASGTGTPWNVPYAGTNYVTCYWNPTGTNKYLVTPGFALTSGSSYTFSFYWVGDDYSGWSGSVYTNTSQSASGAAALGSAFVSSGTTTATSPYIQVSNVFTPSSTGTYYFLIKVSNNSTPYYLGFDNFSLVKNCTPPSTTVTTSPVSGVVCQGGTATLSVPSGAGSYTWSTGATTNSITTPTLTTNTTYTVTATTAGCAGTATYTVTADPTLIVTPPTTTPACSGGSIGSGVSGGSGIYNYLWSTSATTANISVSANGTYNVTVTDNAGCSASGSTGALTVVSGVPSQPSNITGSSLVCSGSTQSYSVTNVSGVTYTWAFPTGWAQTAGGTTNAVTVTVGSGTGNITVTPSNACGTGTSRTLSTTTTTASYPYLNITSPAITNCTGITNTFTAVPGGTTATPSYQWYVNGTAVSGATGSTYSNSSLANGDYVYCSMTSNDGCPVPAVVPSNMQTVHQFAAPTISSVWTETFGTATGAGVGTYNSYSHFSSANISGSGAVISTTTTSPVGGNNVYLQAVGSYVVFSGITTPATGIYGLDAYVYKTSSAEDGTDLFIEYSVDGVNFYFAGEYFPFTAGTGTANTWGEFYSAGFTLPASTNLSLRFTNINTYHTGSFRMDNLQLTMYSPGTPSISPVGPTVLCSGTNATITAAPAGETSYAWSTAATTQSISASTAATYVVTISDAIGCSPILSSVVNVNTKATNPTSVTASANNFCVGGSTVLTLNGGSAGTAGTVQWYSGSCGGTSVGSGNGLTVSPTSTTTYYGRYEDPSPCSDNSTCQSITITVNPTPSITASPATSTICSGTAPSVALTSTAGGTTYSWSVAQGSGITGGSAGSGTPIAQTLSNSSNSMAGTATYIITGNAAGCSATATTTITVNPTPAITATPSTVSICNGAAPSIALTSSVTGTTYTWSVAQGSGITGGNAGSGTPIAQTLSNSSNSIAGTASYTITGNANSCSATATATVTVNPTPVITATPSIVSICTGAAPSIALTSSVSGTSYTWSVSQASGITGGSSGNNTPIAQTLSNSSSSIPGTGTYTIIGTANSCSATATAVVTVDPPVSSYGTITASAGTAQSLCASIAPFGTFAVTGATGGSATFSYQWYSQSGIQSAPTGAIPGSWTLIAGATGSSYTPVGTTSSISYACVTTPVGAPSCAGSATWASGVLQMTVSSPTAFNNGGNVSVCVGSSVTLTASSAFTASWQWQNSPDNVTYTDISGATNITYSPPTAVGNVGTTYYHAIATYSTGTGCTPATSNSQYVTVNPIPTVTATPSTATICSGSAPSIALTDAVPGATYNWSVAQDAGITGGSSGTASTISQNLTNSSNSTSGTATYTITGTANGCTASASAVVTVNPTPAITATPSTAAICSGTAPSIVLSSTATGTTYAWSVAQDASISGGSAGTGSPIAQSLSNSSNSTAGTATYTITGTASSCSATATAVVTVNPIPVITATPATTTICSGTGPGITLTSTAGSTTYSWTVVQGTGVSGGSASSGSTINQTLTYVGGPATGNATYTITGTANSCTATATAVVTVRAVPVAAGTIGSTPTVCQGQTGVTYTVPLISHASTYTWAYSGTGATIAGTGNTVTVSFASNATSGNLTVAGTNTCGNGTSSANYAITVNPAPAAFTPTLSSNPVCVSTAATIQVAGSQTGVNYQLQTATGTNVGSVVAGTGSTINLPSGTLSANSSFKVLATATTGGCATTSSTTNVEVAGTDVAIGTQLGTNHFTFDTLGSAALPSGFSNPANSNSVAWTLNTTSPATSGSYSYINGSGSSSSASTGAYIQTPTGANASTPTVDLISRTINAANYTNISVQWGAQKSAGYTGAVSLYYSIDNGTTWTAVSYTDVQNNVTGNPWNQVNNNVQVKLPAAANNAATLKLKWSANPATDASYYSINDIGVYGLPKIVNCGNTSVALNYMNNSCSATKYNIASAVSTNWPTWPSATPLTAVSNGTLTGSPLTIAVPATTAAGTYDVDFSVSDGAGHTSSVISFPVTTEPSIAVASTLDNCSCNNTGLGFGNVITVYAAGGSGTYYFQSTGVVDSLTSVIDGTGNSYSGTSGHGGVKGVFWSKADGANHTLTVSDGQCSKNTTQYTQSTTPIGIPFSNATNVPAGLPGAGGGNNITGSFNDANPGDASRTNVNGRSLRCHQTTDFGNNWLVYQVNNMNGTGGALAGDSTNNKAVVEINNHGTVNLDSVSVSVYREPNLPVVPNSGTACAGNPEYGLERHFMIKSTKSTGANAFSDPVGVRLFFTDAEFQDLVYWTNYVAAQATGPNAGCAYGDTITNLNSIYVTKYTGSSEDGSYTNNSPSGLYRVFGKNAVVNGNGPLTAIDAGQTSVTTGGSTNRHYVELNVTEFSEFWLGGSQSIEALPVSMIYLEAEAMNNDSIQVRWATASEVNNREFDVERSTDGNTWTIIGLVPGHGNSTQENVYAYNDLNVVPGIRYYYRLKQIDYNGNYKYTDIVQAMLTGQGTFMVMNFVPNPTIGNTQLTVVTTKAQEITVDFYDMIGQKVYSATEQLVAGTNKIDFDLRKYAPGTYSATVTTENQLYTKKIVITH